jgi:hypothetical protein
MQHLIGNARCGVRSFALVHNKKPGSRDVDSLYSDIQGVFFTLLGNE